MNSTGTGAQQTPQLCPRERLRFSYGSDGIEQTPQLCPRDRLRFYIVDESADDVDQNVSKGLAQTNILIGSEIQPQPRPVKPMIRKTAPVVRE